MNQTLSYDVAAVIPEALASGLFGSLCTIQMPSGTLTDDGSPDGSYTDVAGCIDIPCIAAPTSDIRISATERKTDSEIESSNGSHCLLAGWYPILETATQWQAVIDGVTHDITGAESDSQKQMTRLAVQVVTV